MAKICTRCNRPIQGKKSEHVCGTVTIRCKELDASTQTHKTMIVHEDRVEKGGDLHEMVAGEKAPWEVVQRNIQKIEKLADKQKTKKKDKRTLVAPTGEPLEPPKG